MTHAHKAITVIGRIGMKVAAHRFLVVQVCEIMYVKSCHIMHHNLSIKVDAACLQQEPTRTSLTVLLHLIACPVCKGTTVQMMGRPIQSSVCACTCPIYTCTPSTCIGPVGLFEPNEGAAERCRLNCGAGHYCKEGSSSQQPCRNGTFSEPGQGSCTSCSMGFFSDAAAAECTPCKAGHACAEKGTK